MVKQTSPKLHCTQFWIAIWIAIFLAVAINEPAESQVQSQSRIQSQSHPQTCLQQTIDQTTQPPKNMTWGSNFAGQASTAADTSETLAAENRSPESPNFSYPIPATGIRIAAAPQTPTAPTPTPQPATPLPPSGNPAIDDSVFAEIKELRKQLGGGIGESLKGLRSMPTFGDAQNTRRGDVVTIEPADGSINLIQPPPNAAEEIFNQQLRSLMASETSPVNQNPIQPPNQSPEQSPTPPEQHNAFKSNSVQPMGFDSWDNKIGTAKIIELRKCARGLEELAGRLESVASYEVADRLRAQAAILWGRARQQ